MVLVDRGVAYYNSGINRFERALDVNVQHKTIIIRSWLGLLTTILLWKDMASEEKRGMLEGMSGLRVA